MISELSISRFKAIRNASLPLRALNLFAGINGMGKSTCLQTLLLLRQSWISKTLPNVGLLLRGPLVDLGRGQDVLHQLENDESIEFQIATSDGRAAWTFDVGNNQTLDDEILPQRDFKDNYTSPRGGVSVAYERPPFTPGFRYLSAERVGPEFAYDTSNYSVHELDEIGRRGEFAVHYLAVHRSRPLAITSLRHPSLNRNQEDLFNNVRAWMGEISPGISIEVQEYLGIYKAGLGYMYDAGPSVRLSMPMRPVNVGFGITYSFPIIVAALAARAGDTLIIENPESHLHPRGQSQLGRLLALAAAGGAQVFVETHSDHVLNGIRVSVKRGDIPPESVAIFSFDRAAGDPAHDVSIARPRVDRDGKVEPWPPGFFDEAEKLLFELL